VFVFEYNTFGILELKTTTLDTIKSYHYILE